MFTVIWTLVKPFVTANWKAISIVVAIVAVLGCTAYLGYAYRGQKATIDTLQQEKQALKSSNNALLSSLATAQKAQEAKEAAEQKINVADQTYIQGVQDGKTQLDSAINQLHAHVSMLVKQHQSDQRAIAKLHSTDVSVSATGASERDGDLENGFLVTHGEDALRLANEADDVVRQLSECQSYINNIREMNVNQNISEKK